MFRQGDRCWQHSSGPRVQGRICKTSHCRMAARRRRCKQCPERCMASQFDQAWIPWLAQHPFSTPCDAVRYGACGRLQSPPRASGPGREMDSGVTKRSGKSQEPDQARQVVQEAEGGRSRAMATKGGTSMLTAALIACCSLSCEGGGSCHRRGWPCSIDPGAARYCEANGSGLVNFRGSQPPRFWPKFPAIARWTGWMRCIRFTASRRTRPEQSATVAAVASVRSCQLRATALKRI